MVCLEGLGSVGVPSGWVWMEHGGAGVLSNCPNSWTIWLDLLNTTARVEVLLRPKSNPNERDEDVQTSRT